MPEPLHAAPSLASGPDVAPAPAAAASPGAPGPAETSTRERVLELIVSDGPLSAAELADQLDLTSAAIRRHLSGLEAEQLVTVHESGHTGMRGRPARRYVATGAAQDHLAAGYARLGVQIMEFLARTAGPEAIEAFADDQIAASERRYAGVIDAPDVAGRIEQLAEALQGDGFAASVRPVAGTRMVQLCQGHCPVQHVAARFPQLCDAETAAFSRLLGTHVQRLVTLAGGGHVCTTNIPVGTLQPIDHPPQGAHPATRTLDNPTPTHPRTTTRTAEGTS